MPAFPNWRKPFLCSYRRPQSSAAAPWAARSHRRSPAPTSESWSRTSTRSSSTPRSRKRARSPRANSAGLVKKEKLTQEQADARLAEVMGLIVGTTSYEEFGDVDFVIEAVPEKMEIKQAVFRELDVATPGHAIIASNTSSLSITEMGEATLRADKVVGFHFFYPASVMPLVEVIVGDDTSRETATAAYNFAQAIKKQPIVCAEVPGFVVNKILVALDRRDLACPGRPGPLAEGDRRGVHGRQRRPDGPLLPRRPARPRHALPSAEHLHKSYGETLLRPQGARAARRRRQARRQDRRRGLLQGRRADGARRRRPRRRRADRDVHQPGADRGLPAGRGRRLLGARHRRRDDDRRRPRPAQRAAAAVLESRRRGSRHDPRADGAAWRRNTATDSRRPCSSSAWSHRAGSASPPARASTPTRSPTRATRPTRSSSRPAATSPSPGSPTCR